MELLQCAEKDPALYEATVKKFQWLFQDHLQLEETILEQVLQLLLVIGWSGALFRFVAANSHDRPRHLQRMIISNCQDWIISLHQLCMTMTEAEKSAPTMPHPMGPSR